MQSPTRPLRNGLALVAFAALTALAGASGCEKAPRPSPEPALATAAAQEGKAMTLYDFTLKTLKGQDRSLGEYRGKVLLVVNTASECGYTPQYAGLEALQERLKDRSFTVLGFPSNDFGAQEPGSDADIATFCSTKYGVSFPMFSKITVKGSNKHPLYAFLTQAAPAGEVKWNFTKFLIGKDGSVLQRFESAVTPDDPKLAQAIESALRG